jgi:hypothetical protein
VYPVKYTDPDGYSWIDDAWQWLNTTGAGAVKWFGETFIPGYEGMSKFCDAVFRGDIVGALLGLGESGLDIVVSMLGAKVLTTLALKVGGAAATKIAKYLEKIGQPELAKAVESGARLTAERLTHIFGKAEHRLGNLVKAFGSEERAFLAVEDAANKALARGELIVGKDGILPTGDLGNVIKVGDFSVRLIGGRVVDGKVSISSISMKGLEP